MRTCSCVRRTTRMALMRRRIRPLIPAFIAAGALLFSACSSTETSPPVAPSGDRCQLNVSGAPSTVRCDGRRRGGDDWPPLVIAPGPSPTDANWVAIGGARDGHRAKRPCRITSQRIRFRSLRSAAILVGSQRMTVSQAAAACCLHAEPHGGFDSGPGGGRLTVELTR